MTFILGGDDDEELVSKLEQPVVTNPIDDEIVLTPEVTEHEVLSVEMVQNKRPWYDDVSIDMYKRSIPHIDGNRVHAEYFNTLVAEGTVASATSSSISAAHRQYLRINNYPIYLDGELSTDTDAVEQKTRTESRATISGVMPPQTSDYFVLKTGYNRDSVFRIKSVRPLSIYTDRAYEVEYEMQEVDKGQLYGDLLSKTVRVLNYIRENHQLGTRYLLTDDEVRQTVEDKLLGDTLFNNYIAEYYDRDLKVFGVQTDGGFHTDMIIQDFLAKICVCPDDMYTYTEYHETKVLDTIFDVLMYLSPSKLMNVMDKVQYYYLDSPTEIGHISPVLLSPITTMPFQKSSRMMKVRPPNLVNNVIHQSGGVTLSEITIDDVFATVDKTIGATFPNVLQNETYLLSEDFYNGGFGNSLEEVLRNALAGRPIDKDMVRTLVQALSILSHEERFFIAPFLILLVKML